MLRYRALASLCILLTPQVVQASDLEQELSFATPCLKSLDLREIETTLGDRGWNTAVENDALINALAWIGMESYFLGDSGGERHGTIFDIKIKAAKGLLRKKDIPPSKNRYFTRATDTDDEILHVVWQRPTPNWTIVECRAALLPVSLAKVRAEVGAQDLPAFASLKAIRSPDGFLNITLLNSEKFETLTPPDAIVTTYRKVRTEKVTP